jgi:hypothetical protein
VAQPAAEKFLVLHWDELYRQLCRAAGSRTRNSAVDGKRPGDFADEVFVEFLQSPDGFGWSPRRGGGTDELADLKHLVARLLVVMRANILDAYRRDRKVGQANIELLESGTDIRQQVIARDLVDKITDAVTTSKHNRNGRLATIFRCLQGGLKRRDIPAVTGLDLAEVDLGLKYIRAEARGATRGKRQ